MEKIKSILKSYIFDGIVLFLIGAALIVFSILWWPDVSVLHLLLRIVGAVFAVLGTIKIIIFFVNKNDDRKPTDLLIGMLLFAVGLALIIKPDFFARFFFVIMAVLLLYGCALMFIRSAHLHKENNKNMSLVALIAGFILVALAAAIVIISVIRISQGTPDVAQFMIIIYGAALAVEGIAVLVVLNKLKEI